jgi:hypothetical protein
MGLSDPLFVHYIIIFELVKQRSLKFRHFIVDKKKENWQKMKESYHGWKKTTTCFRKPTENHTKACNGETCVNWRKVVVNCVSHVIYLVGAPPNSENKLLD